MNYVDFSARAWQSRIHYDPVTLHDISRMGDKTLQSYKHLASFSMQQMHRPVDAHMATKKVFINNFGQGERDD